MPISVALYFTAYYIQKRKAREVAIHPVIVTLIIIYSSHLSQLNRLIYNINLIIIL
jgi:hypothetical protein